jgi:hypothetical protein
MPLKKEEKPYFYSFVIVAIIGFLYFPFNNINETKKWKLTYDYFDSTEISGVLNYVIEDAEGTRFKIDSLNDGFEFFPRVDEKLNKSSIFSSIAQKGDVVLKHSFGDTLFLFHDGKTYKYKFKKYREHDN